MDQRLVGEVSPIDETSAAQAYCLGCVFLCPVLVYRATTRRPPLGWPQCSHFGPVARGAVVVKPLCTGTRPDGGRKDGFSHQGQFFPLVAPDSVAQRPPEADQGPRKGRERDGKAKLSTGQIRPWRANPGDPDFPVCEKPASFRPAPMVAGESQAATTYRSSRNAACGGSFASFSPGMAPRQTAGIKVLGATAILIARRLFSAGLAPAAASQNTIPNLPRFSISLSIRSLRPRKEENWSGLTSLTQLARLARPIPSS